MRQTLFEKKPDIETRVFLLTALNDGRVKAERVENPEDFRLKSKEPFALIAVDTFLLSDGEMEALDQMGCDAGRIVEGTGEAQVLRPHLTVRIGGVEPFFHALRDVTSDVLLELDGGLLGIEWRVLKANCS